MKHLLDKAVAAVLDWQSRAKKAVPLIDWGRTTIEFGFWSAQSFASCIAAGFVMFDTVAIVVFGSSLGNEVLSDGVSVSEVIQHVISVKLFLSLLVFLMALLFGVIRLPSIVYKRHETAA